MSQSNSFNRRRFLQYSLIGSAAAALPNFIHAQTIPIKTSASPNFHADVEIEFTAQPAQIKILPQGANTHVFKYDAKLISGPVQTLQQIPGSYLGPTLNFVKGQKVRIFFSNNLSEPSIIHWHGMHVPQKSDGHPMYAIEPGQRFVYEFEVVNRAGTNFYHSHTHELTATQVYKGLAGLLTVTDDQEQGLALPQGEYDLPLVLQDRNFNRQNQLQYPHGMHSRMMGFLGSKILVNGRTQNLFEVKSRAYRVRVLNGSNSRIYKLAWDDGTPLTAIGTDGGLLAKPETRPYIMLAPAERVDLWLDFSGRPVGTKLVMRSLSFSGAMPPMFERMMGGNRSGGMGRMRGMGRMHGGGMGMMTGGIKQGGEFAIATFKVTQQTDDSPTLPKHLVTIPRLLEKHTNNVNKPIPIGLSMAPMSPRINGKSFSMDRVMDYEKVELGSIKKIKIFHERGSGHGMMGGMGGMGMMMAHPVHLHGQQYQILSRNMEGMSQSSYDSVKDGFIDSGWKDTVLVMPGQEIEIIKPFQDYQGLFLYHCHNLEHEDLGMMRQFYVG